MATPGELVEQLTKLAEAVQLHDEQIRIITEVLQQMLEKPEHQIVELGLDGIRKSDRMQGRRCDPMNPTSN